ncbi:MAG: SIS domain-containing protein [Desulfurococcales archaeon]|nr:SIS domain-containing protein [Desulfurococcales archaeon]
MGASIGNSEVGYAFGAGDSFAAALATQYLSSFRFVAVDPLSLVYYAGRAQTPKQVAIAISYKGRTREVVKATSKLKSLGWRVIAITSDSSSPLASAAGEVASIMQTNEALPVGVSSFIAMVTALAKLLGIELNLNSLESKLKDVADLEPEVCGSVSTKGISEVIAVGEGSGFAAAYFTCLKFYETLCMPCRAYPLEEFLHAPIYSMSRNALTVIYPSEKSQKAAHLIEVLSKLGVPYVVTKQMDTTYLNIISGTVQGLKLVLKFITEFDVRTPCYKEKKVLVNSSTPLIYFTQ